MNAPYYQDEQVTLYHGDFREVLPDGMRADVLLADPPYGETSLAWDRWPADWPRTATPYADALWCFGSMRMFLEHWPEFSDWRMSQDIVWEKHNGSGFASDRFKRIHEHALHFYRGDWANVYHTTPRVPGGSGNKSVPRRTSAAHTGAIGDGVSYVDDGTRLVRSVMYARSAHRQSINETQKPLAIVEDLVRYACPPGGLVLDIFAGSCTTLVAARNLGMRAVGAELREDQCERAALRLSQGVLDFGEAS